MAQTQKKQRNPDQNASVHSARAYKEMTVVYLAESECRTHWRGKLPRRVGNLR